MVQPRLRSTTRLRSTVGFVLQMLSVAAGETDDGHGSAAITPQERPPPAEPRMLPLVYPLPIYPLPEALLTTTTTTTQATATAKAKQESSAAGEMDETKRQKHKFDIFVSSTLPSLDPSINPLAVKSPSMIPPLNDSAIEPMEFKPPPSPASLEFGAMTKESSVDVLDLDEEWLKPILEDVDKFDAFKDLMS